MTAQPGRIAAAIALSVLAYLALPIGSRLLTPPEEPDH